MSESKTLQLHVCTLNRNGAKISPNHTFRVPVGAQLVGAYCEETESSVQSERGPRRTVVEVKLLYVDVDPARGIERRHVALVAGPRGQSRAAAVEVTRTMHYRCWCFMPDGRPVAVYESDGEAVPAPAPAPEPGPEAAA